jgi:hypothetical protein
VDLLDSKGNKVQQWKVSDEAFDYLKAEQRRVERESRRKVAQWDVFDSVLARAAAPSVPKTEQTATPSSASPNVNLMTPNTGPPGPNTDSPEFAARMDMLMDVLEAMRREIVRLGKKVDRDIRETQAGRMDAARPDAADVPLHTRSRR